MNLETENKILENFMIEVMQDSAVKSTLDQIEIIEKFNKENTNMLAKAVGAIDKILSSKYYLPYESGQSFNLMLLKNRADTFKNFSEYVSNNYGLNETKRRVGDIASKYSSDAYDHPELESVALASEFKKQGTNFVAGVTEKAQNASNEFNYYAKKGLINNALSSISSKWNENYRGDYKGDTCQIAKDILSSTMLPSGNNVYDAFKEYYDKNLAKIVEEEKAMRQKQIDKAEFEATGLMQ